MHNLEDLLKGCKNNDRKSQKILYETYAGRMLAICKRYVKTTQDAEDVLQEGFLKIFNQIHLFRNDGSFEGWMKRIFVGLSIDHFRKNLKTDSFNSIDSIDIEMKEDIFAQISAKELIDTISDLPDGYRIVFNLFAIEGFSHQEIAEKLGISEGTSKSQFSRAKAKLIVLLKEKNIHSHG